MSHVTPVEVFSKGGGFLHRAVSVIAGMSWMMASALLIMVNKHILVDLGFHYPMTVSGVGMLTSSIASYLSCHVLKVVEADNVVPGKFYVSSIVPVGFFMAVTLWAGNQVYLHLTVAFIQMLKAFSPVIVMAALWGAEVEHPTCKMVLSVMILGCGTALAAYGELHMSLVGLLLMTCTEVAEAIRMVMTQFMLVGLKFNPIEGLMYLAPACTAWLLAGAMVTEFGQMTTTGDLGTITRHSGTFILSGCLGFVVNALAYITIKLSSSVTLKVLGTVRNTLLVVIAVVFLGEGVTLVQGIGYVAALAGFVWYQHIKLTDIVQQPQAAERQDNDQERPAAGYQPLWK